MHDGLNPYAELGDSQNIKKILLRSGRGEILEEPIDENPLEYHVRYYPDGSGSGSVSDVLDFYVLPKSRFILEVLTTITNSYCEYKISGMTRNRK